MVFDAHDQAFAFFGGACQRGIYDNMKTAVEAIFVGRERRYNRRFEQMCGHYLVEPVACKGRTRHKRMTLTSDEFIRRFLLHVLPAGFHRIRHYGLFANGGRAENLARARQLLGQPPPQDQIEVVAETDQPPPLAQPCPCCGGAMIVIETFEPGHAPWRHAPRAPPSSKAASPPPSPLRAA